MPAQLSTYSHMSIGLQAGGSAASCSVPQLHRWRLTVISLQLIMTNCRPAIEPQ